jgi:hypothetical protein
MGTLRWVTCGGQVLRKVQATANGIPTWHTWWACSYDSWVTYPSRQGIVAILEAPIILSNTHAGSKNPREDYQTSWRQRYLQLPARYCARHSRRQKGGNVGMACDCFSSTSMGLMISPPRLMISLEYLFQPAGERLNTCCVENGDLGSDGHTQGAWTMAQRGKCHGHAVVVMRVISKLAQSSLS